MACSSWESEGAAATDDEEVRAEERPAGSDDKVERETKATGGAELLASGWTAVAMRVLLPALWSALASSAPCRTAVACLLGLARHPLVVGAWCLLFRLPAACPQMA